MRRQRAAAAILLLALAGCWEDPASTIGRAHLVIAFNPLGGGAFSATVNGRTYTAPGQYSVELTSLDPAYEVFGSFQSDGMRIVFHTTTTAGVQAGSVTSLEGPVAQLTSCSITYVPTAGGPRTFRVSFRLSGTENRVCR